MNCVYCGERAYHNWNYYKGLCETCHTVVLLDRSGVNQWDAKQCLCFLKIFNAGRHAESMEIGYYEIIDAAAFLIAIGKGSSLDDFSKKVDDVRGAIFGLMTKDVYYKEKLIFDYSTTKEESWSLGKRELERITQKNKEAEDIVSRLDKAKEIYEKSAAFERQIRKLEKKKEKQAEDEQLISAQVAISIQSSNRQVGRKATRNEAS